MDDAQIRFAVCGKETPLEQEERYEFRKRNIILIKQNGIGRCAGPNKV